MTPKLVSACVLCSKYSALFLMHSFLKYCQSNILNTCRKSSLFIHSGLQCGVVGQCLHSDQTASKLKDNYEDCQSACNDQDDCYWFTYYDNTKICKMMVGCIEFDESCDDCTTGQSECHGMVCRLEQLCGLAFS